MANKKYEWDSIIKDMAAIIAGRIASGKKPPTINTLYKTLKNNYNKQGKLFPGESAIFTRKIHSYLGLDKNSKNYEPYFYRLAGQYDKMTLDSLATGISVSTANSGSNSSWLFIRINSVINNGKPINSNENVQMHLYKLSQRLKDKFSEEIIFISFDRDTLVIMCMDNNARQTVANYFSSTDETSVL